MGNDTTANINYFSRDVKFRYEKPYVTSFPVDDIAAASVSNHENEAVAVAIHHLRDVPTPSLDIQGFTLLIAPTSLSYANFANRETVRSKCFAELRDILKQAFPKYQTFVFFDYEVRRRSELYPSKVGATVEFAQPLAQAHVDYSVNGGNSRLERVLRGTKGSDLIGRPCDLLNIWRPINEQPVNDWPLALCDHRTVRPDHDVLANDVVYENSNGEDEVLLFNPDHCWWFLSGQHRDEMFVWRNTNLPDGGKPRAFHTAFEHPLSNETMPRRESIEVRVAAFG